MPDGCYSSGRRIRGNLTQSNEGCLRKILKHPSIGLWFTLSHFVTGWCTHYPSDFLTPYRFAPAVLRDNFAPPVRLKFYRGKYSPIPLLSLRSEMIQSITPNRFLIAGVPKQPFIHEILSLRASRKLRSEYNKSIRSPERIFSERRTLTLLCFYAFMKPVIGRLIAHCG